MNAIHDKTHREPIDKTAALVMSKGVQLIAPNLPESRVHSETCPPLKNLKFQFNGPSWTNHTGKKFGRFIVIGMHAKINARWVVRCSCGMFETRSNKAIVKGDDGSMCFQCKKVPQSKRQHFYNPSSHLETKD